MTEELYKIRLDLLTKSLTVLPDKDEETPVNTLNALWSTAAGMPVSALKANNYTPCSLTDSQIICLDGLIAERIKGLPLAYITGRQSFMGLEMIASSDALIPRQETEILASTAINIIKQEMCGQLHVIDTCTGAGNIALAIAHYCENTKVYASDLSEDAVKLAKRNAEFLELDKQVSFYSGDLLESFNNLHLEKKINLLTCNPPYISTAKVSEMPLEISNYEPRLAFDGGSFGVNLIKRLVVEADKYLVENGYLIFEVGLGQAPMIKKLVEKTNTYKCVDTINDGFGNPRVIVARK